MIGLAKKHANTIFSILIIGISVLITVQAITSSSMFSAGETTEVSVESSRINPAFASMYDENGIILATDATVALPETTSEAKAEKKSEKSTTSQPTTVQPTTSVPVTTQSVTIPFATAIPPAEPADYNAQWDTGYLVAIDNPDKTYECARVKLTDEDRDLLERLCYGEFGSGGFIGAALIAQAVKDAMCFDGYPTVQSVIDGCHYDGKTTMGTSDACINAVKYIFDENHDAVQHRIMYMYNPDMVQSAFHESQNYIMTYQTIRFFDRWNY